MTLSQTVPALPVRSIATAIECYTARLGFHVVHQDSDFAIVMRDAAELHLWQAGDDGWRLRPADDLADSPVRTGAEDFLSGTASCRVRCSDVAAVDAMYGELAAAGVLHPTDGGGPVDTEWGTREFAVLDVDGNLLTFFTHTVPRG